MESDERELNKQATSSIKAEIEAIARQEGGMRALIEVLESKGVEVRLPRSAYRIPILESLKEMDGRGHYQEVLRRVERKLGRKLRDLDYNYTELPTTGRTRWENEAHFARNELREEGLISSGSPHGIWELTEKGIEEAATLS